MIKLSKFCTISLREPSAGPAKDVISSSSASIPSDPGCCNVDTRGAVKMDKAGVVDVLSALGCK